jgi:iron-sulfur cluster assembly protein
MELREKQQTPLPKNDLNSYLILRMGVRNGGCSGMSYVMDFATEESISLEEDQVDIYEKEKIKCVVDSKSMLYCKYTYFFISFYNIFCMIYIYSIYCESQLWIFLLYIYTKVYDMELDYSDALIGGGFKFYNPNSQDTCGCGSSFSI